MVESPEESKYRAQLTLFPNDTQRNEETPISCFPRCDARSGYRRPDHAARCWEPTTFRTTTRASGPTVFWSARNPCPVRRLQAPDRRCPDQLLHAAGVAQTVVRSVAVARQSDVSELRHVPPKRKGNSWAAASFRRTRRTITRCGRKLRHRPQAVEGVVGGAGVHQGFLQSGLCPAPLPQPYGTSRTIKINKYPTPGA
jgi:hypothetical protein